MTYLQNTNVIRSNDLNFNYGIKRKVVKEPHYPIIEENAGAGIVPSSGLAMSSGLN